MSRGAGLCPQCGGPKRGRGARIAAPSHDCPQCGEAVCDRHAVWSNEQGTFICKRCDRKNGRG